MSAAAEAAARVLLNMATQNEFGVTPAQQLTDTYGPGAFYVMFDGVKEARAWVSVPSFRDATYCDAEWCQAKRFADAVLGIIAGGRAAAVVVVDIAEPGTRCYNDAAGDFHSETMRIGKVPITVGTGPAAPAKNAMCRRAEEAARTLGPSPLYYVEYDADADTMLAEAITLDAFDLLVHELRPLTDAAIPSSMLRVRNMCDACAPDESVIFLRVPFGEDDQQDTTWHARLFGADNNNDGRAVVDADAGASAANVEAVSKEDARAVKRDAQ